MEFLPFEQTEESIFLDDKIAQVMKIVHSCGQASWTLPSHSHPDQAELLYIDGGKGIYTVDNYPYHVSKGDIVIFNSNVVHSLESDYHEPLDVWSCAVRGFQIKGLPANHVLPAGASPVYATGERGPHFLAIYQEILKQRQDAEPGYNSVCNLLANALLTLCFQTSHNSSAEEFKAVRSMATEVLQYIDHHYNEPLSMTSLAKEFHISSSRLSHIMSETFHVSPINYLIDKRIRQAQWELVSTNYSIKDIAEHVGYDNTYHFCNLFVSRTGLSPSELRERYTLQNKEKKKSK